MASNAAPPPHIRLGMFALTASGSTTKSVSEVGPTMPTTLSDWISFCRRRHCIARVGGVVLDVQVDLPAEHTTVLVDDVESELRAGDHSLTDVRPRACQRTDQAQEHGVGAVARR